MSFLTSGESLCPIAQTLALVGERWTILIIREMFMGSRRFDELQMYTDISPRLLSLRLKSLEKHELISRRPYEEHPARYEYRLTQKGLDLFPLVLSLKAFGDKWASNRPDNQAAMDVVHNSCGHATDLKLTCSFCADSYGPRDTTAILSPEFELERQERRLRFIAKHRTGRRDSRTPKNRVVSAD